MEALYGVMLLITLIIGIGIGLLIPILIKKYIKAYELEKKKPVIEEPKEEEKRENDIPYIPKDLLLEWMTGEELKKKNE